MKKHVILLSALVLLLPLLSSAPVKAADSTSFDPTRVEVKAKGAGGVPVGTIVAWPVASNPEDMANWLECDGRSISSAVYPELYAVVGGSVPDYRGLFMRGVGGNSAGLGSYQGDAIRNITGTWASKPMEGMSGDFTSGAVYSIAKGGGAQSGDGLSNEVNGFDASRVVPTAEENRPVNRAVRYLIRAKP